MTHRRPVSQHGNDFTEETGADRSGSRGRRWLAIAGAALIAGAGVGSTMAQTQFPAALAGHANAAEAGARGETSAAGPAVSSSL